MGYYFVCLVSVLGLVLSLMFVLVTIVLSKVWSDSGGCGAFECGFSPFNSLRSSFSVQFFMVGVLFLVFDIELVLLMPIPLCSIKGYVLFALVLFVVLILLVGLYYEWGSGYLEWSC